MNPLVSIIVVNWNGEQILQECLRSLQRQKYPSIEIIVVDNASSDSSIALIRQQFESVQLLENKSNLGFAGGNNVGIRKAKGKYLALLNNDAVADPQWISEMVNVADSNPAIGMCASKIYSYDDREILDSAGGLLIYEDGLSRGRGRGEKDIKQFDKQQEVLLPSGCACLYRKSMVDEIGPFDEDFFAYSDDTDLGLRARIAGWQCIYVPTAIAYHRYSASAGRYSPLKAFLAERNRIWVAIKTFPLPNLLLSPLYTFWRFLLHAYALLTAQGATGKFAQEHSTVTLLFIIMKAYFSALKGFPKTWKKRQAIQKTSKISSKDFCRYIKLNRMSARELAFKE